MTERSEHPHPQRAHAVLVAGMHRTGTSALTRVMNLRGLELPRNLLPANHDNDRGFWESPLIIEAHDRFLEAIGSSYDDIAPISPSVFSSPEAEKFTEELEQILRSEYGDSTSFVVKDPRLCRLIPLWLAALERYGARPSFVITTRNPLEVAGSLRTRNGFSATKSYLLWLRHLLDAERDSRGFPRAFTSYELLLGDWVATTDHIARELHLSWARSEDETRLEIEEFLSSALRHHSFDESDLQARSDVAEWVKRAYEVVSRAATGADEGVGALFDEIRAEVDRADQAYGPLLAQARHDSEQAHFWRGAADAYEEDRDRWQKRAKDGEKEHRAVLAATLARVKDNEAKIESLGAQLDEARAERERLGAQFDQARAEREALWREAEAQKGNVTNLEEELRELVVELATLRRGGPWSRRRRTVSQFRSWLVRGKVEYIRQYVALRRSFDDDKYLAANRDVAAAGLDPLMHYIEHGAREGRQLEPAVHHDAAQLDEPATEKLKVLLVGHDAHLHGAQMILLHIGDTLKNQFGCEVACLLLGDGALVPRYEQLGRVYVTNGDAEEVQAAISELRHDGFELAVTNTVVSGSSVPPLKAAGFRVVSLIHELPGIIGEMGIEARLAAILEESDTIVAPARKVADSLERSDSFAGHDRIVVRPQGLYKQLEPPPDARARLRRDLGLADDARVVVNVGFGDLRKGIDTFVDVAKLAASHTDNLHLVWVGRHHPDVERLFDAETGDRLHLVPHTDDLAEFYFGADAFFLSSREDPFPSVVLEAMAAGLPVVGFAGTSGSEELIARHGRLVEPGDLAAVVTALDEVTREDDEPAREARATVVAEQFRYDDYCFDLLRFLDPELEKVSVVVPNYNYARHLDGRMRSIFDQTYPVFETIVLDDGSTDDSLARLADIAQATGRRFRVVANDENSGSPFVQWERGARLARGTYVWVAEADDGSYPQFLEEVVSRARREGASLAFSDSVPIGEDGVQLAESYKGYYRESVGNLMDESFDLDGTTFVERFLAERNLVLNASAVVWEREALIDALDECLDALKEYRLTGDWHLYAAAGLRASRVSYLSPPLNVHRRHDSSVTASLDAHLHVEEVVRVQAFVAERLGVDDTARERMRAYADMLRGTIGMAAQETTTDDDPAPNGDAPAADPTGPAPFRGNGRS